MKTLPGAEIALSVNVAPAFVEWTRKQDGLTKTDIVSKWEQTESDVRIVHGHKSAKYARLKILIDGCKRDHGYEPPPAVGQAKTIRIILGAPQPLSRAKTIRLHLGKPIER